jgi:hypothetical protein
MKYVIVVAAVVVSMVMAQGARAQSVGSTHAMFGGIGGVGGSSFTSGGGFGRYYYPPNRRLTAAQVARLRALRARNYRRAY